MAGTNKSNLGTSAKASDDGIPEGQYAAWLGVDPPGSGTIAESTIQTVDNCRWHSSRPLASTTPKESTLTVLACPNQDCDRAPNTKTLAYRIEMFVVGDSPQMAQCPGCHQEYSTSLWIRNTAGCALAEDTYFFAGDGKKSKWIRAGGMAMADQAGPATGTGARVDGTLLARDGWGAPATGDVSIHVVDDDVTLMGEYSPSAGGRGRHILILSGSGDDAATYRVDRLMSGYNVLGHSCIFVDYRGYGSSSGNTTKQGMYSDTRALLSYVTDILNVAPTDVVLHGWSIGSAPAMEAARTLEGSGVGIKGVVLQCPISSSYRAARAHGVGRLSAAIGYKMFAMNNDRKIKQLRNTAILILKGNQDNDGFQAMADRLHDHGHGTTLAAFDGGHADHNAIFRGASGTAITNFLA